MPSLRGTKRDPRAGCDEAISDMLGVVSDYVIAAANLRIGAKHFQCYIYIQISTMSTGYQIDDQFATYFLTLSVVDWVDIFTRSRYRDIIIDSFNYCIREKGMRIYAYVIMTNHVHLIANSSAGKLSDTIRDFKKFTASSILDSICNEPESRREWLLHRFDWNASKHVRNSQYQFWTHENHAISVSSQAFFRQKLDYIHKNPVRAGWVEREEDYTYSSAAALYNGKKAQIPLEVW
jgi:REP element-mobilizing transposase RayT